eukprot:2692621-Pyramimonas_sp.AAC.1
MPARMEDHGGPARLTSIMNRSYIGAPKVYSDLRGTAPRECSANAMLEGRGNACPVDRREQPRPRANPDPARGALPLTMAHPGNRFLRRKS